MMKKRFLWFVIFIIWIPLNTYSFSVVKKPIVRLGNLKFVPYGAISYIKELAPSCGIRVEERIFASGREIMAAIAAGDIDVGANTAEVAIAGRANGTPIYMVAGIAKGGVRIVARPGLGIKHIPDLKGKRIGITRGSTQELLLYAQLSQAGLSAGMFPGKDVQVIDIPFSNLNQALLDKKIDVMVQSEPHASQAINQGFGIELMKTYDTSIGEPVRVLVMTEKLYKEHRTTAAKFMECFLRAIQTFTDKPDIGERYIRKIMFKGQLSEDDFRDASDNFSYDYQLNEKKIQATTELMGKYGIVQLFFLPLTSEWVKLDLLESVRKNLIRNSFNSE